MLILQKHLIDENLYFAASNFHLLYFCKQIYPQDILAKGAIIEKVRTLE